MSAEIKHVKSCYEESAVFKTESRLRQGFDILFIAIAVHDQKDKFKICQFKLGYWNIELINMAVFVDHIVVLGTTE